MKLTSKCRMRLLSILRNWLSQVLFTSKSPRQTAALRSSLKPLSTTRCPHTNSRSLNHQLCRWRAHRSRLRIINHRSILENKTSIPNNHFHNLYQSIKAAMRLLNMPNLRLGANTIKRSLMYSDAEHLDPLLPQLDMPNNPKTSASQWAKKDVISLRNTYLKAASKITKSSLKLTQKRKNPTWMTRSILRTNMKVNPIRVQMNQFSCTMLRHKPLTAAQTKISKNSLRRDLTSNTHHNKLTTCSSHAATGKTLERPTVAPLLSMTVSETTSAI